MSEDMRLDRASTLVPSLHARFRSRRDWRTSASGTLETCRPPLTMSVSGRRTTVKTTRRTQLTQPSNLIASVHPGHRKPRNQSGATMHWNPLTVGKEKY